MSEHTQQCHNVVQGTGGEQKGHSSNSTPLQSSQGSPDNTHGSPDNTHGSPDNTHGSPDNTLMQLDPCNADGQAAAVP